MLHTGEFKVTVGSGKLVGAALIKTEADALDVQPPAFVTVKVYEPDANPVSVVVVPLPVADPEGVPVTVQVPEAGNPLKATDPVGTAHVGWVTVPITGTVGGRTIVTGI